MYQKRTARQKPRIKIGRFIDPLSDFGFKRLFGSEPNKELLIAFLNDLLEGKKVITGISYHKNERQGPRLDSRKTIYDLNCTGEKGEEFVIEVQRIKQSFFKGRAIYYISRLIHDQTPKGSQWDYSLKEVYFIGLMEFSLEDSDPAQYLHHVNLSYVNSGKPFYKKLDLIFIEIPKFVKKEHELNSGIDKWLFILKNISHLEKMPESLGEAIL